MTKLNAAIHWLWTLTAWPVSKGGRFTNYISAELVALLTHPLHVPRSLMVAFIEGLKTSPYVEIVNVDSHLDEEAWQFLKSVQDKKWSLVDCASFVVMRHRCISEALTSDHHFGQAGFVCLLKA